jgi:hypothetical protein
MGSLFGRFRRRFIAKMPDIRARLDASSGINFSWTDIGLTSGDMECNIAIIKQ